MQNEVTLKELDLDQLEAVGGGGASTEWGVSTGAALAFTVGAATVGAPLVAGALAVGGVVSAGFAIYYALTDDEASNAS
jgi:hypothetical protein